MSFEDGWAALNLDMPPRVPRTEFSAESYHWPLIAAVTGLQVNEQSPAEQRAEATRAFVEAWNYDFSWSTLVDRSYLGPYATSMGHAAYAEGGTDMAQPGRPSFNSPEEVLAFDPVVGLPSYDHNELVRQFNDHYAGNCARFPTTVNMTGTYITVVSGLIDLLGWDLLLLSAGTDPVAFGEFVGRYVTWMRQFYLALAECDSPVVMMHDDITWTSGPFVHPDWYRTYVFPGYRTLLNPVREAGKKIAYTSDGDFTEFIDDIVESGVHGFVMEPLTDMAAIAERYSTTHFFIGNADTRILLSGSPDEIEAEVERCMSIGKRCPGYFMAVGNHIPANTPVESALHYNRCYEARMWR